MKKEAISKLTLNLKKKKKKNPKTHGKIMFDFNSNHNFQIKFNISKLKQEKKILKFFQNEKEKHQIVTSRLS